MSSAPKLATFDDLWALGSDCRAELIHGAITPKAMPSHTHSALELTLGAWVHRRFHRRNADGPLGGWRFHTEIHVVYQSHEIFCHDLAGWRRERAPALTRDWAKDRPDWACELLSPNHEKRDLVDKMGVLHEAGVPHYWIVNPEEKILQVYRHEPRGYLLVLSAASGQTVRAEPFDAAELRTGIIFDDEDDDP